MNDYVMLCYDNTVSGLENTAAVVSGTSARPSVRRPRRQRKTTAAAATQLLSDITLVDAAAVKSCVEKDYAEFIRSIERSVDEQPAGTAGKNRSKNRRMLKADGDVESLAVASEDASAGKDMKRRRGRRKKDDVADGSSEQSAKRSRSRGKQRAPQDDKASVRAQEWAPPDDKASVGGAQERAPGDDKVSVDRRTEMSLSDIAVDYTGVVFAPDNHTVGAMPDCSVSAAAAATVGDRRRRPTKKRLSSGEVEVRSARRGRGSAGGSRRSGRQISHETLRAR